MLVRIMEFFIDVHLVILTFFVAIFPPNGGVVRARFIMAGCNVQVSLYTLMIGFVEYDEAVEQIEELYDMYRISLIGAEQ